MIDEEANKVSLFKLQVLTKHEIPFIKRVWHDVQKALSISENTNF